MVPEVPLPPEDLVFRIVLYIRWMELWSVEWIPLFPIGLLQQKEIHFQADIVDTRKYANCISCRDCNVNLCTQYFTEFHTTWALVAEKDALKEKYEADSDENNNM